MFIPEFCLLFLQINYYSYPSLFSKYDIYTYITIQRAMDKYANCTVGQKAIQSKLANKTIFLMHRTKTAANYRVGSDVAIIVHDDIIHLYSSSHI